MKLTQQQEKAMQAIRLFLDDDKSQVFILKGYAGTGKTTLIGLLKEEIAIRGEKLQLMAPTGRAAKVLRTKLQEADATTIHKAIYQFGGVTVNESEGILRYIFPLNNSSESRIYIVDEASMVSSRKANSELFQFGTGVLLEDLLTFSRLNFGSKLIFVGDPMQLPPVGDNQSAALDEDYFKEKELRVKSYELTDVVRQGQQSAILSNATAIRELLKTGKRNHLVFERREGEVMNISAMEVAKSYCENYANENSVVCYSNRQASEYNRMIREILFPGAKHVVAGDRLMVVNNSYYSEEPLLNGDIINVVTVSTEIEELSAPVVTDIGGKKRKITVTLTFREISYTTETGRLYTRKIIESLLENSKAALSVDEMKSLYISAVIRIKDRLHLTNTKSEAFAIALNEDPYFNALQVKYGYAFTCHKAQGGEWNRTYVDFAQRTGLDPDALRWKYTAITRARQELYCINLPNITPLSKLKVNPIIKAGKTNSDAISLAPVPESPFHSVTASIVVKAKYWAVHRGIEGTSYRIKGIISKPYREIYEIDTPSGLARIDCVYNGAGVFTSYTLNGANEEHELLLPIFENQEEYKYQINYTPTVEVLQVLHQRMVSLCDELEIIITNIVTNAQGYNVAYYLITSGRFATITFYYDKKGFIGYAAPTSECGMDDLKLQKLIEQLT